MTADKPRSEATMEETDPKPALDLDEIKKDIAECVRLEAWPWMRGIAGRLVEEVETLRQEIARAALDGEVK